MFELIKPSESMWKWFNGEITIEAIICYTLDKAGGWHISYSATELLKDIGFLTDKGNVKKDALKFIAGLNHEMHYRKRYETVLVNPITGARNAL